MDGITIRKRLKNLGDVEAKELRHTTERLAADGASEDLVATFIQAVGKKEVKPKSPKQDEGARSAAEAFLFARLDTLPETAGLFELNGNLDFRFGNHPAEIDILCKAWRLAIEIDGYYHFQDPENYRRDRRKDMELQKYGFLVIRFLADDVVARLEDIIDTILEGIAHQRLAQTLTRS